MQAIEIDGRVQVEDDRQMRRAAGAALLMALLASCGGTPKAPTAVPVTSPTTAVPATSTTVSVQALASQLSAAENSIIAAFNAAKAKLNDNSTIADLQTAINPVVPAVEQYITTLTDITWPQADLADAHALISAASGYLGVLNTLSAQTLLTLPTWESQLSASQQQEKSAANILRHDVGLPPLPLSS